MCRQLAAVLKAATSSCPVQTPGVSGFVPAAVTPTTGSSRHAPAGLPPYSGGVDAAQTQQQQHGRAPLQEQQQHQTGQLPSQQQQQQHTPPPQQAEGPSQPPEQQHQQEARHQDGHNTAVRPLQTNADVLAAVRMLAASMFGDIR